MRHISEIIRQWLKKHFPLLIVGFFLFAFPSDAFAYDACDYTATVPCTNPSNPSIVYDNVVSYARLNPDGTYFDTIFGTSYTFFSSTDFNAVYNDTSDACLPRWSITRKVAGVGTVFLYRYDEVNNIFKSSATPTSSVAYTEILPCHSWYPLTIGYFRKIGSYFPLPTPANDTIDNPLDGDYKPTGDYTFSGKCTHPGLNYTLNWRDWNYPTTPNITCNPDYTWSFTYNIAQSGGGGRAYYLYNYETESEVVVSVIGYDPASLEWFASLDYPKLDNNNFAKVQTNAEFPIRIKYTIPEGVDRTQTSILMRKYTDPTFSTVSASIVNNTLSILDELQAGFFDNEISVSDGLQYFRIDVIDNNTSTTQYSQKITIQGTSDTEDTAAQGSILPDNKDLGFWGNLFRDMFVPRPGFMNIRFSEMRENAEIHFPLYFQLSDIVQGSASTSSVVTLGSLQLGGQSTAPITFFNPASWNPDTFSGLRSFLSMLMYVWLMYFVLHKVSKVFSS